MRNPTNKAKTNVVVPVTVSSTSIVEVVVPRTATQHSEVPTPFLLPLREKQKSAQIFFGPPAAIYQHEPRINLNLKVRNATQQ
jgi:hypothetical protein